MNFNTTDLALLHLVLLWKPPSPSAPLDSESQLTEFELIRLAKLWEGGEGAAGPELSRLDNKLRSGATDWVTFISNDMPKTFSWLSDSVRRDAFPCATIAQHPEKRWPYVTGSVQGLLHPEPMDRLVDGLNHLQGGAPGVPDGDEHLAHKLLSLSGVLRALISFEDTRSHELPSIFKETVVGHRVITAVHKGTFLRVADSARMPSPYFLLPHGLVLHNEYLLREAVRCGHTALENARAHRRGQALRLVRAPRLVNQLHDARREINRMLDARVDAAVIHYPNLRVLYADAARSRGQLALHERAERYSDELRDEAEALSARQRTFVQTVTAVVVLALAGAEVVAAGSTGLGIAAVVLVAIGVLVYASGHFGGGPETGD